MEEVNEEFIAFNLTFLSGQNLRPDVLKSLDICINGSYRFIHLNDLVQYIVFLPLFDQV